MKWLMLAIIFALWAGYMLHEDLKQVPHSTHIAIHLLYAALALAVLWLL